MIKNINKFVTMVIVLSGMSGCASNSMSPEAQEKINHQTGFQIENVKVNLIKNPFFSEDEKHALYMSPKELEENLKRSISKELPLKQINCQGKKRCLNVDIDVDYARAFVMASNMLDRPKMAFNMKIKDGDKLIHTQQTEELTMSLGTLDNMLVQTNIGSNETNTEREVQDLEVLAEEIADRLQKLTQ